MSTWFDTARFGMFIHWGHSSQQGVELSWPMVGGNAALPDGDMTVAAYQSSAATFNPAQWDPAGLARTAKSLGMQYAVFTTKHHDGYAMFHTKTSDFGVEHSPYGRDIVREFVEAFRAEGLRVGLLRPQTLYPFPEHRISELADNVEGCLVVEMNAGQMLEDVRLAVGGQIPVSFFGRMGGMVPMPDEILDAIEDSYEKLIERKPV